MSSPLSISSWSAFERTAYADVLAAFLIFLMLAVAYVAGAVS
jgi:hypothetical protein